MTFTEPRLDPSEHSTMTTSLDLSFTDSNAVNETLEKIVDYVDLQNSNNIHVHLHKNTEHIIIMYIFYIYMFYIVRFKSLFITYDY